MSESPDLFACQPWLTAARASFVCRQAMGAITTGSRGWWVPLSTSEHQCGSPRRLVLAPLMMGTPSSGCGAFIGARRRILMVLGRTCRREPGRPVLLIHRHRSPLPPLCTSISGCSSLAPDDALFVEAPGTARSAYCPRRYHQTAMPALSQERDQGPSRPWCHGEQTQFALPWQFRCKSGDPFAGSCDRCCRRNARFAERFGICKAPILFHLVFAFVVGTKGPAPRAGHAGRNCDDMTKYNVSIHTQRL